MLRIVLFGHIVGAQILFAALALEWVILRQSLGRRPPADAFLWLRAVSIFHRAAGAILLLTGLYLAATLGLGQFGWVRVAMAALVVIVAGGVIGASRMRGLVDSRSAAPAGAVDVRWLSFSFGARVAATLATVYIMVAKTDSLESLLIVIASAVAGALVGVPRFRRRSEVMDGAA